MATAAGRFCLLSARRARRPGRVGRAAFVAGMVASISLNTSPATAVTSAGALSGPGPVPGTIFVANGGAAIIGGNGTGPGSVTGYRPGVTGNARPVVTITAGINGPSSVIFDSSGDLWVSNVNINTVVEYSRRELAKAHPVPAVTITSADIETPVGVTVDPSGDVWVGNQSSNAEVEFTNAEVAKSGSPVPVVSISPNDCSLGFDSSGDLWEGSNGTSVSEWTRSQLAKSGSPKPKVTISNHSLAGPCRPYFDSSGNLWVAGYNGDTALEWSKAELAKSGSPVPKVIITSSLIQAPGDVAVDKSGDLWVPSQGKTAVVEYTKAQLAKAELPKSSSPTPAVTISGPATGLNDPWSIAIEP